MPRLHFPSYTIDQTCLSLSLKLNSDLVSCFPNNNKGVLFIGTFQFCYKFQRIVFIWLTKRYSNVNHMTQWNLLDLVNSAFFNFPLFWNFQLMIVISRCCFLILKTFECQLYNNYYLLIRSQSTLSSKIKLC